MRKLQTIISSKVQGFTLIELAVVIVVISLVTGMGMMVTSSAVEGARRAGTENRLAEIEKAFMRFRNLNDRLPCPSNITLAADATYYGEEATAGGTVACNAQDTTNATIQAGSTTLNLLAASSGVNVLKGGVPTRSLGLPDEFMFDAWGRRISYHVDPEVVKPNAFNVIPPDATDCSINVADNTNLYRSGGVVYALLSHGKNGHGAYVNGSTQLNAGVTNFYEKWQCWCDAAAATSLPSRNIFFMREPKDATTTADMFDDIVRYKERWQLQNSDDAKKTADFKEYQLAVNYGNGSTYYMYKRGCRGWAASKVDLVVTATGSQYIEPESGSQCQAAAFTADNNTLLTHCDSEDFTCQPYRTNGKTIVDTATPPASTVSCLDSTGTPADLTYCVPTCPQQGAYGMVISNNDYIAIPTETSPYLQVYKASNTATASPYFAPVATSGVATIPALPSPRGTYGSDPYYGVPTTVFPVGHVQLFMPTLVAFSKNAEYLFISDQNTYATMYARVGDDTFKLVRDDADKQATGLTCGRLTSISGVSCAGLKAAAFSPDGKYFSVAYRTVATGVIKTWKITSGTTLFATGTGPFSTVAAIDTAMALANFAAANDATVSPTIAFSPDSKYMVVAGGAGDAAEDVTAADNVFLFKIDAGDVFTDISNNILGSYAEAITPVTNVAPVWTPDSQEFLVPVTKATGGDILSFQKRSDTVFELYAYPEISAVPQSPFRKDEAPSGIAINH